MFSYTAKEKEVYDKIVRYYEETNNNNKNYNSVASKILGENINGRIFIILLSDNSNKFWDFTHKTVNEILKLYEEGKEQDDKNINKYYEEENCDK